MTENSNNINETLKIPLKGDLYSIFNDKTDLLNELLAKDEKLKPEFIINLQDRKIFNFLLIYFKKSGKLRDMKVIMRHRNICKHLIFNKRIEEYSIELKYILAKIFHIFLLNSSELCSIFGYKKENFIKKIFHLIRVYFLNNILTKENLTHIIRLSIYECFHDEKNNNNNEGEIIIENKNIVNIPPLEMIINFLLSFTEVEMSTKKINEFNHIINTTADLIKQLVLQNYNNINLLSNTLQFYRILELAKISLESINRLLPILKMVYKFSFKYDYFLNDLSEQFLIKTGEDIEKKNKNIISKNIFLQELFGCEKYREHQLIIKHGFVFNDNPNNGLVFYANDSFSFPRESYSMVISFKLMKIEKIQENNKSRKYCIFSVSELENFQNTKYAVFIEDKKLKIYAGGNTQELFDDIRFDQVYNLWIFSDGIKKKNKTIFYLNDKKVIKTINYVFDIITSINLGFQDYKQQNNFEGVLGTFLLFNKCFIKEDNDPNNLKRYQFFEKIFLDLKCNYEDIIYINYQTDYSLLSEETQDILNELNSDNISRFIEVIISSKSVVSNDFCCSNKKRKVYKSNYFCYKNEDQIRATIRFKSDKISPIIDNNNFSSQNCLITYPIHLYNSFDVFINNDGIKFLEMELYYFIGVIEYYSSYNINELMKLSDIYCEYIHTIFKLFLYCITELTPKKQEENKENIEHFFYTLNNLIEIKKETGFKIDYKFLISISSYMNLIIKKINLCGFMLDCESYDFSEDKTLDLLFQTILIDFEKHYKEFLIPNVLEKILNFSKIYLSNELESCKKSYSLLIQNILYKIIDENKIDCLSLYIKEIKNLQKINKPMNFLYNNIQEENDEETDNYLNPNNKLAVDKKLSLNSRASKFSVNFSKLTEVEKEKERKEREDIIMMYKLIKNLYLCLDVDKKRGLIDKFNDICLDSGEKMIDFFNSQFIYLKDKYETQENDFVKSEKSDNYSISDEEEDESEENYKNNIQTNNKPNEHNILTGDVKLDKETMKKYKYIELIKSICIRFIDEMTLDNIKNLKNENSRNSLFKSLNQFSRQTNIPRNTSVGNFYKSGSSSSYNLPNLTRNSSRGDFYLNSNRNSENKLESLIESTLAKNFEFYDDFTITPYTFNSFFLVIFRNWTSRSKLKFIKALEDQKFTEFILTTEKTKKMKDKKDVMDLIPIILQMIQKIGEEDSDTIFMNKIEFLEYAYNRFNKFIADMLEKKLSTSEEAKKGIKDIKNNLFCKQDYLIRFYLIIFNCLKKQKDKFGMVQVYNGRIKPPNDSEKEGIEKLGNILKKLESDLKNVIDKTLYDYTDIFYFKLLFTLYRNNFNKNDMIDFIFRIIEHIIEKLEEYEEIHPFALKKEEEYTEDSSYIKVGLNNKDMLLLIYQITFLKANNKYLIENEIFEKNIVLYLTNYLQKKKLVYLKIFFPVGEKDMDNTNKTCPKKLIIEMLFEIFFSLYSRYKEIDNQQYSIFESLINELFEGGKDNSITKSKKKNIGRMAKSVCYEIDDLSLRKKYNEFTKGFFIYLKDLDPDDQSISVIILFLVKLSIYIKILEGKEKTSNLIDFFVETSELLCENAKNFKQKNSSYNTFLCSSSNSTQLYEDFTMFILKEYSIKSVYNKEEVLSKINLKSKDYKKYINIDYTLEGEARLSSISTFSLAKSDKKKNFYNNSPDEYSFNKNAKDETTEIFKVNNTLRYFNKSSNSTNELTSLIKDKNRMTIGFFNTKKEKKKIINYKIIPQFLKYFLRTKFSIYFIKLLTYDEDFIKIKKIYYYLYHNDIDDINKYTLNYPSKLKNRLGNVYVKHFLKKDFNFTSSQYFQYSHQCIHERNFIPSTKVLFPSKKFLEKHDFIHKELNEILKNKAEKISWRICELITYDGAIFGNIFLLDNCLLFISDIKNDKRKAKDCLECACCSMDFDFLEKDTIKVIEYIAIKNVFPRKFLYTPMSLEIFMKCGKSYLFNFFNENTNDIILSELKAKNIKVIKNAKEYFDKKDYARKWKDGKKSTYDYLLILNKFSSRTYNDSNQYPLMPWIYMENQRIRDFDVPMSLQNEDSKDKYLKIPNDNDEKQNRFHSNHYSTSAYICYYLMRTNPFTDSMIKFQSNNFDVPERQFSDVKQTLLLCEYNNNNREPIPELYTIPEAYINLNYNDFGIQTLNKSGRIHNVKVSPYASNAYEFVYDFKYKLNNNADINTNINMWFDFIFGVNQYNKDNQFGAGFRNFNKYCYGQNINIKKICDGLRKKHKTDCEIYNEIKTVLGLVISFGQCPSQILFNAHPKRTYTKGVHNIVMNYADKQKLNKDEQDLLQAKGGEEKGDDFFISYDADESMVQKDYDDKNRKNSIIYFNKSISKNNLYCILNNKEIEVYQRSSWSKDYKFVKKINVSKNYLLFKKNSHGYPILKPEFLFCELKEEHFIFCRYLDNSIKLLLPNMETQFLLDSFITSVIRINENEFITGDNKGKLCHWKINFDLLNMKLSLIKKVKSNKNNITAMLYNKKLNIIIAADNNTVVIRSFYDFEFLTYIDINSTNPEETIVDVKCSNYDFVYVLINKGNNCQELRGYSLNGICFGTYKENITNFEITTEGKILVGLADKGMIYVLNPINFKTIFSRFIISGEGNCYFYHFYFEEPNIIFLGFKDKEGAKIKIIQLNKDEIKTFI